MKNESLEHYLSLNYPYELTRDIEQDGYFVSHPWVNEISDRD